VINPDNPFVLHPQLTCAAYELPLRHADEHWWPGQLDDGVRRLVRADELQIRRQHHTAPAGEPVAVWSGRGWPAGRVGLRRSGAEEIRIATGDGTLVGTVDRARAFGLVHPGAVYLHQGAAWRVRHLDLDDRAAIVEPTDGSEYTQPRRTTELTILQVDRRRALGRAELALGAVQVVSQVIGYRRLDSFTGELLATDELDLPATELVTRGVWFTVDDDVLASAEVGADALPGSLHAAEHGAIGLLPLFTICDRWDVGGISTPRLADTGRPTVVIYDGYPGGAGIAELGFEHADTLVARTIEVIESCPCDAGCPSCVQSPKCGNGNEPLDKAGAVRLLRAILASG
jgi:DEAD/DEAH box helicase domain-containing protein